MDSRAEDLQAEAVSVRDIMSLLTNMIEDTRMMLKSIEDLQSRVTILEFSNPLVSE